MFNRKKYVSDCPCDGCITFALCINKKVQNLIFDCPLLNEYVIDHISANGTRSHMDGNNFYVFCQVMGIKTKKRGNKLQLTYTKGQYANH